MDMFDVGDVHGDGDGEDGRGSLQQQLVASSYETPRGLACHRTRWRRRLNNITAAVEGALETLLRTPIASGGALQANQESLSLPRVRPVGSARRRA